MRIVDSQVHIITPPSPERPWRDPNASRHHGLDRFGPAELIAEMDQAGVSGALVVPTFIEGDRNDTVLEASLTHPERLAAVGRLDITAPASPQFVANWRSVASLCGVRITFKLGTPLYHQLTNGTADWLWAAAETSGLPLFIHAPTQLAALRPIARRHPGLRLTIDHLGVTGMRGSVPLAQLEAAVDQLLELAPLPNVAVKASGLPALIGGEYPYKDAQPLVARLVEAFTPHRVFWGSDLTRMPCTYDEMVTMFTQHMPFLSGGDLDLVMGDALVAWLDLEPFAHV